MEKRITRSDIEKIVDSIDNLTDRVIKLEECSGGEVTEQEVNDVSDRVAELEDTVGVFDDDNDNICDMISIIMNNLNLINQKIDNLQVRNEFYDKFLALNHQMYNSMNDYNNTMNLGEEFNRTYEDFRANCILENCENSKKITAEDINIEYDISNNLYHIKCSNYYYSIYGTWLNDSDLYLYKFCSENINLITPLFLGLKQLATEDPENNLP